MSQERGRAERRTSDLRSARLTLHRVDVDEARRIVSRSPGEHDRWAPDFPADGEVVAATALLRAAGATDGPLHVGDDPLGLHLASRRTLERAGFRQVDDRMGPPSGVASGEARFERTLGALTVRAVGPEDWREWRALRRAALAEAPTAFGSRLEDWSGAGDTEERWRGRLAAAHVNVVADLDDRSAAMASGTYRRSLDAVEVTSMWVAPEARGTGVGDLVLSAVLDWAATAHPGARAVLSVKVGNDRAAAFYARHGFVDEGPSPEEADERLMGRAWTDPSTR